MTQLKSISSPKSEARLHYALAAVCPTTRDMIVTDDPTEIIIFAEEHGPVDITRWPLSDHHAD